MRARAFCTRAMRALWRAKSSGVSLIAMRLEVECDARAAAIAIHRPGKPKRSSVLSLEKGRVRIPCAARCLNSASASGQRARRNSAVPPAIVEPGTTSAAHRDVAPPNAEPLPLHRLPVEIAIGRRFRSPPQARTPASPRARCRKARPCAGQSDRPQTRAALPRARKNLPNDRNTMSPRAR